MKYHYFHCFFYLFNEADCPLNETTAVFMLKNLCYYHTAMNPYHIKRGGGDVIIVQTSAWSHGILSLPCFSGT